MVVSPVTQDKDGGKHKKDRKKKSRKEKEEEEEEEEDEDGGFTYTHWLDHDTIAKVVA